MILLTYGTRPEYIKVKPLIDEMTSRGMKFKTLFTGQHKDIVPKGADYSLTMNEGDGNRLDTVMKNCLSIPDQYFEGITHVLVQGDTTSVVGLAIAAMHRQIKVIHLEAGLRTYDFENPYPEEYNRCIVSSISSLNLCPTNQSEAHLLAENVGGDCHVVGNTVLDNLLPYKKDCEYTNKVLVTMHRRENHHNMGLWFTAINDLAKKYDELEFIIPLHPNPNVQKHKNILKNVTIIDPLSHEKLVSLLVKVRMVITDSGGIQEECSFFNKKALVCRKVTERPESVGLTSFLVHEPHTLKSEFKKHIDDYVTDIESPFGDGKSSQYICDLFESNGIG
jgi:UDP-N-acetylglucosamine 2-epimerase (non-hydrolysing)